MNEISTKKKKVITLRKGQELPEGYEIASIDGEYPKFPDKLAEFPAAKLKEAILGVAINPKAPADTVPPAVDSGNLNNPTSNSAPNRVPLVTDMMITEMQNKSHEKGRLVYKQRSPNASKVINLINRSVKIRKYIQGTDAVPITQDKSVSNSTIATSKKSPPKVASKSKTPQSKLPHTAKSPQLHRTSVNVVPSTMPLITRKVPKEPSIEDAVLLGCKFCGETFPFQNDNLLRKHILIKHDQEIEDTYFEDNTVKSRNLRRCKTCSVVVLNKFREHWEKCSSSLSVDSAFEDVELSRQTLSKHHCGICRGVFKLRYQLRDHLKEAHSNSNVSSKVILDPDFRCSQCLKRFADADSLIKHCVSCTDLTRPRTETIMELARSLLICDFCNKKHSTLAETTSCYLKNSIYRCVLCTAVHKDKSLFYRHLHAYHGLRVDSEPKLTMSCPVCGDIEPDRYTAIFPHVVTIHFSPMLQTRNQTLPMPPPLVRTEQPEPKKLPPSTSTTAGTTTTTTIVATTNKRATNTIVHNVSAPSKPLIRPPSTSGIVINTNRVLVGAPRTAVTDAITLRQPGSHPIVRPVQGNPTGRIPTPRQQLYALNVGGKLILVPVSQVRPATFSNPIRNPQQGSGAIAVVRPVTTITNDNNNKSAAVTALPISVVRAGAATSSPPSSIGATPTEARSPTPVLLTHDVISSSMPLTRAQTLGGPGSPLVFSTASGVAADSISGASLQSVTPHSAATSSTSMQQAPRVQIVTVDGRPLSIGTTTTLGQQFGGTQLATVPTTANPSLKGFPRIVALTPAQVAAMQPHPLTSTAGKQVGIHAAVSNSGGTIPASVAIIRPASSAQLKVASESKGAPTSTVDVAAPTLPASEEPPASTTNAE